MHLAARLHPDQLGNSVFPKLLAVFEKREGKAQKGSDKMDRSTESKEKNGQGVREEWIETG